MRENPGFTLIELLIVIAILGILVAILVPNMLMAVQKSKQKATIEDMRAIVTGIEAYTTDWDLPPQTNNIRLLSSILQLFYIKNMKMTDGWGHFFIYTNFDRHYSLGSPGKDSAIDLSCSTRYNPPSTLEQFKKDVIFSDGLLICGPKR